MDCRSVLAAGELVRRWSASAAAIAVAAALAFAACEARTLAHERDDDRLVEYRPGLVATYVDERGVEAQRVDYAVQFAWRGAACDARLAPGPFRARWRGQLFVLAPGEYRFHLHSAGKVTLSIAGEAILDEASIEPSWHASQPLQLTYGHHSINIDFETSGEDSCLALFWEGPQFQLEPVSERCFFHDPTQSVPTSFERGQELARALRCDACHAADRATPSLAAPSLAGVQRNLSRAWLIDWLAATPGAAEHDGVIQRRMPYLAIERADAEAIADYLFAVPHNPQMAKQSTGKREVVDEADSDEGDSSAKPDGKKSKKNKPRTKPSAEEGAKLFHTVGCLACHRMEALGAASLFGGGDLTHIASKRPEDFFERWLADPASINRDHRMPVFELAALERADLAVYLASKKHGHHDRDASDRNTLSKAEREAKPSKEQIERGRRLVAEHRCNACHAIGETKPLPQFAKALSPTSDWSHGCANPPDAATHRPGFQLAAADRVALETYFRDVSLDARKTGFAADGGFVLRERNCLACHQRGLGEGIAAQFPAVVGDLPELATMLPLMTPPALNGVGDKLHDKALRQAILLKRERLRPWLSIRMPRFDLGDEEMDALVRHLIDSDRIPDRPVAELALPSSDILFQAGGRLVTSDGFGCTSCHKIGSSEPVNVALNAHGTDLSMVGSRIRPTWFDRWVHNPARIVPRMEMPSIQMATRGVLDERLDVQLAAVWHSLNTPGFDPPPPNPVRTMRARNMPDVAEPANVLTDVLEIGDRQYIKPLLVGLPNRHNVLFDLDRGGLASWWIGDTARQRTRGKSWYWEANGVPSIELSSRQADIFLMRGNDVIEPLVVGQAAADIDWWQHVDDGLSFGYRLTFAHEMPDASALVVRVSQTLSAIRPANGADQPSGFRRMVLLEGVPREFSIGLRLGPGDQIEGPAPEAVVLRLHGLGDARVETSNVEWLDLRQRADRTGVDADAEAVRLTRDDDTERISCTLKYLSNLPVDRFPVEFPPFPAAPAARLDLVPGFEAVRLPLPISEMPTALAWRPDGTLVFCSLKGRVWLARDTNGDRLEDQWQAASDELAAPYGLAAYDDYIDVVNKYALVRLWDRDHDGRSERTEIIASGWGHSDDYHDWAVGLPRDESGNYYVALPCQQDERTEAEAYLRGHGLRLVASEPTLERPRLFSVESMCAGLRFPMGLIRNREGDLFTTDNQGNYNPYNELNHWAPGARYGFINNLEERPGFNPPFLPPAIEIPHPWSRSINGACFLDTPPDVLAATGRSVFGPFEGHLLGCEMDYLRLVRMSLERVGDVYQGAVYPMSRPAEQNATPFEGPLSCGVAPDGAVYIGNLRDSGWGGGQNTGSLVRMERSGDYPPGIAEITATPRGFRVAFTTALDRQVAARKPNYAVASARRISTPAYGGDDVDVAAERIHEIIVADDAASVELVLDRMREGFVYEFRLSNLVPPGTLFFPDEAYYTLRKRPENEARRHDEGRAVEQ